MSLDGKCAFEQRIGGGERALIEQISLGGYLHPTVLFATAVGATVVRVTVWLGMYDGYRSFYLQGRSRLDSLFPPPRNFQVKEIRLVQSVMRGVGKSGETMESIL